MAMHVVLSDDFGTCGGIVCYYLLQFGMTLQEGMALSECYGVRMDFFQGTPIVFRQADAIVLDAEFMFSHDGCATFAQQLIIVQQASCNGIFDGEHTDDVVVLMHLLEYFLEGIATYQFYFLVLEELVGSNVME
jgi:hypothetical protein